MKNIMNELRYRWLKLVVWYYTNFSFQENEVQLLSIRFVRKNTISLHGCNIIADLKNWVIVTE